MCAFKVTFSRCVLFFVVLLLSGCAHHFAIPDQSTKAIYVSKENRVSPVSRFSPFVLIYEYQKNYNRIGKPTASKNREDDPAISIDTREPEFYTMQRSFTTSRATYTNLAYRIHFPEVPFSLIPFHLTWGDNVGLIVVVTLNENRKPVLITTVHTCGCYLAIVPTTYLPQDAYPRNWDNPDNLQVYGETLPPVLDFTGKKNPRLLVHVRPGVHRIMDLEVIDEGVLKTPANLILKAGSAPMKSLWHLHASYDPASFYYRQGVLKGHVKGSIKPWETLLLSFISLDLFVGSDKAYADTERTDNPFYTSLKPWNRDESNMWYFKDFLDFWGWRL